MILNYTPALIKCNSCLLSNNNPAGHSVTQYDRLQARSPVSSSTEGKKTALIPLIVMVLLKLSEILFSR